MIIGALVSMVLTLVGGLVELLPQWPASGWTEDYTGLSSVIGIANMFAPVSELLALLQVVFAGALVYLGAWAVLKVWAMVRG